MIIRPGSILSRPAVGGLNMRGAWAQNTAYALNDGIIEAGGIWKCIRAGTSDDTARKPGFGGYVGLKLLDGLGKGAAGAVAVYTLPVIDMICACDSDEYGTGLLHKMDSEANICETHDYGVTWTHTAHNSLLQLDLVDKFVIFDSAHWIAVGKSSSNARVQWTSQGDLGTGGGNWNYPNGGRLIVSGLTNPYFGGVRMTSVEAIVASGAKAYRSTDEGYTWVERATLIDTSHNPFISLLPTTDRLVCIVCGNNGTDLTMPVLSLDAATKYSSAEKIEGANYYTPTGCSLNSGQKLVCLSSRSAPLFKYSSDNGTNWTNRSAPADSVGWTSIGAPTYVCPGVFMVFGRSTDANKPKVWRSVDYGASWQTGELLGNSLYINPTAIRGSKILYLGDGVYVLPAYSSYTPNPTINSIYRWASLKWERVA